VTVGNIQTHPPGEGQGGYRAGRMSATDAADTLKRRLKLFQRTFSTS
jgi:hypothetical protein